MNDLLEQIEEVLDDRVRPFLRSHGGAIEIDELSASGVLGVRLLGVCAGCPSADLSMRAVVREELMAAVPGIADVVQVGSVSEDLLDQARRLLSHGPEHTIPLRLVA